MMVPALTFSPGPPMGPGSPFAPVRPYEKREQEVTATAPAVPPLPESFSSIPHFCWGCSHGGGDGGARVGISLCYSATNTSQNKLGLVPVTKPGGTGEVGQHRGDALSPRLR